MAGGWINRLVFNGRGDRIAVESNDNYVYMLDRDGDILWKTKLEGMVWGIDWSPDNEYLVAVTKYGYVYIMDSDSGKILAKQEYTDGEGKSSIWIDYEHVVMGDSEGYVYFYSWDGSKLDKIYSFKAAGDEIVDAPGLSYNPIYGYLAVASNDGYVYVYDINGIIESSVKSITGTITHITTITRTVTSTINKFYTVTTTCTITQTKTLAITETIKTTIENNNIIVGGNKMEILLYALLATIPAYIVSIIALKRK